jgi:mRNA interferase MazF
MGTFASRPVVVISFPFSDLSATRPRPALILANAGKDDWMLCQTTSKPYPDVAAIELTDPDFAGGSLQRVSYARPCKVFTTHESLFRGVIGSITRDQQADAVWMKTRFVSMPKCWGSSKKHGDPLSVSHECRFPLLR